MEKTNTKKNEWLRILKNLGISYVLFLVSISFGLAKDWVQGLVLVFLAWSIIYIFQMYVESAKAEAVKDYQKKQWEEDSEGLGYWKKK